MIPRSDTAPASDTCFREAWIDQRTSGTSQRTSAEGSDMEYFFRVPGKKLYSPCRCCGCREVVKTNTTSSRGGYSRKIKTQKETSK